MPTKPGKFGIKFWLCCHSSTYYILDGRPYVGKDPDRVHVGLGEHVVLKLTNDFEGWHKCHNRQSFYESESRSKAL